MSVVQSHSKAKQVVSLLISEARKAGWLHARFEIRPDGSVTVEAGMREHVGADDFFVEDLRMK
ncbi:hypothetical protein SAMN04488118_102220 [Epibacterium ulvae]|uniref:Uncharacterized protein n=1 Tax=Epibacterium ulvae TaxID=1156985 RepID=A0A1G5PXJ0_9RHOB|nr:hypothetical protein [Epibacterium ulvae]SCZ53970.1 hypothetical protein SAMN04488118_102220 [Epibacterium ulvae]